MNMSDNSDTIDLQPLFKKLGHKLEEIRLRALNNILSKLQHGVVCESDLVQERHLLIRLLEWFNHPQNSKHEEVMQLLLRLSKHTSAASILRDIGAVEFLSEMRSDCKPDIRSYIDQLLENLFLLPESDHMQFSRECVYQHTQAGLTAEAEMVSGSSNVHNTSPGYTNTTASDQHQSGLKPPSTGYFYHDQQNDTGVSHTAALGAETKPTCFKFSTFPWVALTPTDRHVLSSTDNSLRSRDSALVVSACEFLRDVVFQDFPAEVFLQRPNIVKSLLSLLSVPATDNADVTVHAAGTLCDLAHCVKARIAVYQDPALYSPKRDLGQLSLTSGSPSNNSSLGSLDTRPSVIGRSDTRHQGDGQDGDSSSGSRPVSAFSPFHPDDSALGNADVENSVALQFHQLSVPQFCLSLMKSSLPCLKTNDMKIVHQVALLLHVGLNLLEESTTLGLWADSSASAREMTDKIIECLEIFADILQFHHHSNAQIKPQDGEKHRIVFMTTAIYLAQMIKRFVPLGRARSVVPETLTHILGLILLDENLAHSYPSLRWDLIGYVQTLDGSTYQTYQTALAVCQAMHNTCKFLKDVETKKREMWPVLVSLANDAILSLPYHTHLGLVEQFVCLCSEICSQREEDEDIVKRSRKVLLKFLSHPLAQVRIQAYTSCTKIVKEAIGIKSATEPQSEQYKEAIFIADRHVLYDICCFGLSDTNESIARLAEEIMLYLLQGQLLMSEDMWCHLLESVVAIYPVLQGFSSLQTPLGNCIMRVAEVEAVNHSGLLPQLERFRSALRLLFHPQSRVRGEALSRLAWFLTHEENSNSKLPVFSQLDVKNLTNVFLIEKPRVLEDYETGKSVFQVEGMMKVFDIVMSASVEVSVRKSGVEQLSIILQDSSLHPAFKAQGGVDSILGILSKAIMKTDPKAEQVNTTEFIPACLSALRHLVHHDSSLRRTLAHSSDVYYTVVRGALLHMSDDRCRYEASHLLALLLFDEVATLSQRSPDVSTSTAVSQFSVPFIVTKRFQFPFIACTHHGSSAHSVELPPTPDPLLTGPPAEMLKVAWQVAWHDGIEMLIQSIQKSLESSDNCEYSRRLVLNLVDQLLVTTSHLKMGMQACIHGISNATSHDAAVQAIIRLRSYVVCGLWHDAIGLLHSMAWMDSIHRFLKIIPSSVADESLLCEIVTLITLVMRHSRQTPHDVLYLVGSLLNNVKGPLVASLSKNTPSAEDVPEVDVKRQLNKAVLTLANVYVSRLPYALTKRPFADCVRGDLAHAVLQRLNLADAAQFFNLSSLESTLACLMHITARPGWSQSCSEIDGSALGNQMLKSLLEVVFAFHVGRGGISMSYMGKGVTRCSTLCLQHLAYEMALYSENKEWSSSWLFAKPVQAQTGEPANLMWLIPLWAYRDPEVRSAGLGIAVALAMTETGRMMLASHCQQIPGGIWGAAFSILLDQSECSLVRQQAALLLVNLTSQNLPNGSVQSNPGSWQGPVIQNPQNQVSLCGVSALLALLHHSHFYQEVVTLLANFYPQSAIHPVSVANTSAATTPVPSEATLTTSGNTGGRSQGNASNPTIYTSTPSTSRNVSVTERHAGVGENDHNLSASHASQGLNCSQALSSINEGPPRASTPRDDPERPSPPTLTTGTATPVINTPASIRAGSEVSGSVAAQYQSVATPSLVSSVCRLLSNVLILAPEDTLNSLHTNALFKSLTSMVSAQLLEVYVGEVQSSHRHKLLALSSLLNLYTDILHLMTQLVSQDATLRGQLLEDEVTLTQVVWLLAIKHQDQADVCADCDRLHQTVYTLMTALLKCSGQSALVKLTPILTQHWTVISESLSLSIGADVQNSSDLAVSAQNFMAVLFVEEGKRLTKGSNESQVTVNQVLNLCTEEKNVESGAILCEVLVKAYDRIPVTSGQHSHSSKVVVVSALKALLAVSSAAKRTALQAGLMESLAEHIKDLHTKLNMDALQLGKSATKKKEDPVISDLILTLDLIRNLIYQSYDAKTAAVECRLAALVHKLWAWCQMYSSLMITVLALLSTFTARCPPAASSLALSSGTVTSTDRSAVKPQHGTNSLVHCLVKFVQREMEKNLTSASRAGMSVLANLALCAECRNIMWKSNFLVQFSNLTPPKNKKSRGKNLWESLWLDVFVNLSFSTEGQTMVLKTDNVIDLLLEFGASSGQYVRPVTLILRNLCFHASNKPKLLTHEKLLPYLMTTLESGDDELKAMVLSGLWALLYNNQKAKVAMKNANLVRRLHNVYNTWIGGGDAESLAEKAQQHLQAVIQTLAE